MPHFKLLRTLKIDLHYHTMSSSSKPNFSETIKLVMLSKDM